jgi:uncharacterized membrane protein YgdD (TMEM256/DUF423 family)
METEREGGAAIVPLWAGAAGLFGLLGVASGAFAAHALKARLEPQALDWLRLASAYWLFHAPALLGMALLLARRPTRCFSFAAGCLTLGGLLFSGSLALMALTGSAVLASVTPFGGVLLLLGWGGLAVGAAAVRR